MYVDNHVHNRGESSALQAMTMSYEYHSCTDSSNILDIVIRIENLDFYKLTNKNVKLKQPCNQYAIYKKKLIFLQWIREEEGVKLDILHGYQNKSIVP